MQANLYLKFENLTAEEKKEIDIAINVMEKIKTMYEKVYGYSDALGFNDALMTLDSIKNNELF